MSEIVRKRNDKGTSLLFEERLWQSGIVHVCGVDEVGRGSLAGPCAVIFERGCFNPDVVDSKLMSAKKRQSLEQILNGEALDWKIGVATAKEIDFLNIRQATFLAMRRAMNALKIKPDYALIDGENLKNGICPSSGIIKGDQKSFTIAAASIIAKQRRDNLMIEKGQTYPVYRFDKNKGYGTREHIEAIVANGQSSYHRETFLKKLLGKNCDTIRT
jgi:ribonuclease HII